ncbi:MAG: hypothetical protein PUC39_09020, partial [Lachnospiraceae bacterium]|nr:hypothetical protein [Lachnospiraceae bacterium]
MKNRKKLRRQIARLTVIFYLLFVTTVNMAVPGTDNGKMAVIETKAAGSYTVQVSNFKDLANTENAGCKVYAYMEDGNRSAYFTFDKSQSTNVLDGQFNIYSVKYDNQEYYYSASKTCDGTTPGLYYSDGWKFVFPSVQTGTASIEVQLTQFLYEPESHLNVYDTSYQFVSSVGSYETFTGSTVEAIKSAFNEKLQMDYFDYSGTRKTISFSSACSVADSNQFGYDSLRFLHKNSNTTNHFDVFDVQYGVDSFLYQRSTEDVLQVWSVAAPAVTAYRKSGTNQVMVDTNQSNATKYAQVTGLNHPNTTGTAQNGVDLSVSNSILYGTGRLELPEEGIYLPGKDIDGNEFWLTAAFAVFEEGVGGAVNSAETFTWAGPAASNLGNVTVGTTGRITDNLTDVNGSVADFAGYVTKVGTTTVTEDTPYKDEYVTIDYYGNVTVLKAGRPQSYTLTTQTKYTKFQKYSYDGFITIVYENSKGIDGGTAVSDIQYGYQDWEVSLTVTPTGSASEATTTTEKITEASTEK